MTFVLMGIGCIAIGVVVGWISGQTVFNFTYGDPRIKSSMVVATAISAAVLVFGILRLLFAPSGYFFGVDGLKDDGTPDSFLGGANLQGLAIPDPAGFIGVLVVAVLVGAGAYAWARRGENARLFPVWVGGLTTGLVAAAIWLLLAAVAVGAALTVIFGFLWIRDVTRGYREIPPAEPDGVSPPEPAPAHAS